MHNYPGAATCSLESMTCGHQRAPVPGASPNATVLLYFLLMAPAQANTSATSRLDRLNIAAALLDFDQSLKRSAWGSLGWGIFSLAAGIWLVLNNRFGWINVAFGLLLMLEGLYEMRVREPKVIQVAAATLGILALWNLSALLLAIAGFRVAGAHPLVAFGQLLGAWMTYKSYADYAALLAESDPGMNEELKMLIHQLKNADPANDPDVVEFISSRFSDSEIRWRVRSMPGSLFFMGNEMFFGRRRSKATCLFVPPADVKIEITGEKTFGNKQKAVVTAAGLRLKAIFTPEMAQKLMAMC